MSEIFRPKISPNHHSNAKKVSVSALALATALSVGAVIGNKTSSESEKAPSANAIAEGLNSDRQVADGVVIEVGYQIPLEDSPVEGAVSIVNPIKLGEDTYGYVSPSTQTGKVTIGEVHYEGPLQPVITGGYNKAYAHEVTTSVALVYDEHDQAGDSNRYYSVVMGDQSGDIESFANIVPGVSAAERGREFSAQMGQLAQARVGDLVYYGK